MATNQSGEQGKQPFIKRVLEQNRDANVSDVNQAWQAAGRPGTISRSLVGKVRGEMGLTSGKSSPRKTRTAGTGRRPSPAPRASAKPPEASPALENGTPMGRVSTSFQDRAGVYEELESDLDRVLFRVMAIGTLPEVERLIRQVRRLVILGSEHPGQG